MEKRNSPSLAEWRASRALSHFAVKSRGAAIVSDLDVCPACMARTASSNCRKPERRASSPASVSGVSSKDRKSTRLKLQSLMRISYAVFCLKKKNTGKEHNHKALQHHYK